MDRVFIILLLLLLGSNSLALNCDGKFEKYSVVKDEEWSQSFSEWSWVYSTKNHSISGKTLIHKEYDSFSIHGGESEDCLKSNTCSVTDLVCAISFALVEPYRNKLPLGRLQVSSYGLYLKARDAVKDVKDCEQAYSEYYSEISKYWKQYLSDSSSEYKVKSLHPREIKSNRPASLGDGCFEYSSDPPGVWYGIDYFPVVTIELNRDQ